MKRATWNAAPFIAQVNAEAMRRMRNCMVVAVATAKENMQELGPGVPSTPGDYPAKQSTALETEITFDIEASSGQVVGRFGVLGLTGKGKALEYAYFLEVGTSRMEPRPWVTLTFDEVWGEWKRLLGVS